MNYLKSLQNIEITKLFTISVNQPIKRVQVKNECMNVTVNIKPITELPDRIWVDLNEES